MKFAPLLRWHMQRSGLSGNRAAAVLGVSPAYISKVLREQERPLRLVLVAKLAKHMGLDTTAANALMDAAAEQRGGWEVPFMEQSPLGRRLAAFLSVGGPDLTDEDVEARVARMLEERA